MQGIKATASIYLAPEHRTMLTDGPFVVGSRSILFEFDCLGVDQPATFGAVLKDIDKKQNDVLHVELYFWSDLAQFSVRIGAVFSLWHGGSIGNGTIVSVQ